jgi:hypothetical protein
MRSQSNHSIANSGGQEKFMTSPSANILKLK